MQNNLKYHEKYPNLFRPITIRGKTIKNRIVSSPHGDPKLLATDSEGRSIFSRDAALYYGGIARGGAGIVNTGHLGVDPHYRLGGHSEYFDFFTDYVHLSVLPSMHRITDQIHLYGALASIELNHGGHFNSLKPGHKLLGPCDCTLDNGDEVKGLSEEEMDRIAEQYAHAAWIGKRGGFDVVNVHAGHNWLLSEFFSPIENQRTDRYGGSVENRARFPKMVLDRIRERVGEDMIIAVRFSGSELTEGGITIDDASGIIRILQETADLVQITAGKIHNSFTEGFTFPMQYMVHGCNTYLAHQIRERVNGPIETIGGINDPEMAERLISEGTADFVGMARTFIADPDWAEKARQNRTEDIRPCLRCLRCMNMCEPPESGVSHCTVNPRRAFLESPRSVIGSVGSKRVAVIGGGPAGMNAAIELAAKGHGVTLYEKSESLGGRLKFADHVVFKEDVKRYREYLVRQVNKHPEIRVFNGFEPSAEMLRKGAFDAIVVAVGAQDFTPLIPGTGLPNVLHSSQLFGNEEQLGGRVIIVGGGMVGCEATVHLQSMGKAVDVIEMRNMLMKDADELPDERIFTRFYMDHEFDIENRSFVGLKKVERVRIHLNTRCVEITPSGVFTEDEHGARRFIEADTVIMATGLRKDADATEPYVGLATTVIAAGDCWKVGDIYNASSTGYAAAFRI